MSTINQAKIRESPPAKDRRRNDWATLPTNSLFVLKVPLNHNQSISQLVLYVISDAADGITGPAAAHAEAPPVVAASRNYAATTATSSDT